MAKDTPSLDPALIQRKGAARPAEQSASAPAAKEEPRTKSLTLRLTETQYERLREFAFRQKTTHQAVCEAALVAYLDSMK